MAFTEREESARDSRAIPRSCREGLSGRCRGPRGGSAREQEGLSQREERPKLEGGAEAGLQMGNKETPPTELRVKLRGAGPYPSLTKHDLSLHQPHQQGCPF